MARLFSAEILRIALAGQGGRGLLSVLAIALGVALGYAIHLIHAVAVDEMEQAARSLTGEADLAVQSLQGGMDEALYPRLATRSEVAVASPVLELEAKLPGRRERLRVLGLDVFRAAALQPAFASADSGDSLDTLRPDRLFLNPAAAAWLGARAGDEVILQAGLGQVKLRVAGLVRLGGPPVATMDIAGAQASFGRLGRISRIDLRLAAGVDAARFARDLATALPEGVRVEAPQARAGRAVGFTRAYRVNLDVLALVALFTGGLLVFSGQALAVVRRRSQLALLRALGMLRQQVVTLLVVEGALVGLAGGIAGIALGYGLARVVLETIGPDLGAAYFRGIAPAAGVEPPAAAAFLLLGVVAAAAGSLAPALEAARTAPARALHAGDEERAFARLGSPWPGVALMTGGTLAALLPPVADLPLFGYGAIALLLLGCIALLPRAARAFFGLLPLPRSAVLELAVSQLRGAPGQASVSLAPLVASVAVAAAMAIMVGSFRASLGEWLDRMLPADLYLRAGAAGDTAFFSPDEQAALRTLPGVGRIEFLRSDTLSLAPDRPSPVLLARVVDRLAPGGKLPLVGPFTVPEGSEPPVWVSEVAADIYGWRVGDRLELPLAGRTVRCVVAGVWRDYARSQGAIVMERETYVALTGDTSANEAALWLAPGAQTEELRSAAARILPAGSVDAALPAELRRISLAIFDRTFAATYALEAAAVAVGLAGLSASFAALVLARRREFGVLCHLGVTRRQIAAMLACQGALLAGIALAVGLTLGGAVSLILIHVINRQSFHWSMDLSVPWGALAWFAAATALLAAATALASGRQAMRREAALAVKEDW